MGKRLSVESFITADSDLLTADIDDEYGTVGTIEGGPHLDLVQGDTNGRSDSA